MARTRLALAAAASSILVLALSAGSARAATAPVAASPPAAAPAAAVHEPIQIAVLKRQARLLKSGDVKVRVAVRCDSGLDAFELDLGVSQGTALAADTPRTPFPVCDGRWHAQSFVLPVLQGTFTRGPATVSAFVVAYSQDEGDLSAETSAQVCL